MTLPAKLRFCFLIFILAALGARTGCCAEPSATTPPAKADAPISLSVADAVKRGQACNPLPKEAEARVASAIARLRAAGALPNPTIALAEWTGKNTGGLDENVVLSQAVELGDKRGQKMKAAKFERDSTVYDRNQVVLDVSLAVQSAYYSALRADVDYQVASELLAITKQFQDAAKTQFSAGDVARSNVLRAEVEVSRAQQEVTAAEKQRADAYSTLRSLLLIPETCEITLSDKLAFVSFKYQLADLEALACKQRPDLLAERLTRASAEASLHGARVQSQPDAFVEYRQASFDPSEGTSVRGGLVWPLMDLGSIRADVADKKAALAEQEAKLAEAERTAKLEVETALHALDEARKVVESFESGRIARAKELLDMVQTGYDRGASSYLDVLDAQRSYRSEQADYARALADYNIALATLQRAVGGKL